MDGQDGNGLQLGKHSANVFRFCACVLQKSLKNLLWFALLAKIKAHLISPALCSRSILYTLFQYDAKCIILLSPC